jgi:hypothetical protein
MAAEEAAHEARRANVFGIIAATLSLATVVGLIVTIWQTQGALGEARRGNRLNLLFERRYRRESKKADADQKRALEIASKNADAASRMAEASESNARHQLRAYISLHDIRFDKPLLRDKQMRGRIKYKNNGQTPARNIKCHLQIGAMIDCDGRAIDLTTTPFPKFEELPGGSRSDLGSGEVGEQSVYSAVVPEDLEQRVIDGSAILFLRGIIRYSDVFGNSHGTRFAWHRDKEAIRMGMDLLATEEGNSAD